MHHQPHSIIFLVLDPDYPATTQQILRQTIGSHAIEYVGYILIYNKYCDITSY